ncbi:ATP-binding protein [Duganella sp. BuS-21]|uniref:sensor histidine kinase n=1 Tax=Duganella sp. BuS-21 TaxID=2943848 RepID=UPI0035A57822
MVRRWQPPWRRWSVRNRLMAMTAIPLAYLFFTFLWYAYHSRLSEVREELAERGPLVAKVLADSSEFSVIARRHDDLKPTINGLLRTDPSIHRIDVLDAQRRELVAAAARAPGGTAELRYYEAPILKRLMWVAMLGPDGKPYQKDRPAASGVTVETIGYVRVTMSPSALLLKQTRRFYVELLVGSLGLLACVLLAWQLAKGLDASLQASMQALREADAEKRRLIGKVNTAVEDERKSIALEIHDELNATLIAVRLEGQRIADLSPEGEVRDKAQSIIKLALGLYNSGRSLVRRLRPEVLDMLGLEGAVEELVRHYDSARSGCRFDLQARGDFSRLEGDIAISAYRIVQEALSNIVKHARATQASLSLALEQGELRIRIADNGRGFDAALASAGIGLVGMRERVYALNGSIALETSPEAGTLISIAMPIR